MKTIEGLEKQLADALARERQLRGALECYKAVIHRLGDLSVNGITYFEEPITKNAESARRWMDLNNAGVIARAALSTPAPRVFTVDELNDICEIHRTEIANLKEQVRVFESWHKDPRVFTAEEVRPLVEALRRLRDVADTGKCEKHPVVEAALTHARKLGMEGGA